MEKALESGSRIGMASIKLFSRCGLFSTSNQSKREVLPPFPPIKEEEIE